MAILSYTIFFCLWKLSYYKFSKKLVSLKSEKKSTNFNFTVCTCLKTDLVGQIKNHNPLAVD